MDEYSKPNEEVVNHEHAPVDSHDEEIVEEVEYVDEDGNPIPEDEVEEYEEVDEQSNPTDEVVEYVDEDGNPIPEDEVEEYEEVDDTSRDEPEQVIPSIQEPIHQPLASETIAVTPEPVIEEEPQEVIPEPVYQPEYTPPSMPEVPVEPTHEEPVDLQRETLVQEPIEQPAPHEEVETVMQEVREQIPVEEKENTAAEILQDVADISGISMKELQRPQPTFIPEEPVQEQEPPHVEPVREESVEVQRETLVQEHPIIKEEPVQEEQTMVQQPLTHAEQDTQQLLDNARLAQETMAQPQQEPAREESTDHFSESEEQEHGDMLQKLSMTHPTAEVHPQTTDEQEKTPSATENKSHPHLSSTDSMESISRLTERIFFSSDDAYDKLKKKKISK